MRYAELNTPKGGELMKLPYTRSAKFKRHIILRIKVKGQICDLLQQVLENLITTLLTELIVHIILSK